MSGVKGSKYDSGASKRKRKQNEAKLVASMHGSLYKHFTSVGPMVSTTIETSDTEDARVESSTSFATDRPESPCQQQQEALTVS